MRLFLEQDHDVMTVHFETLCMFERHGVGLVRSLLKNGSEAEKFAMRGLIHDDFLMVFIDSGHANSSGNHYVSMTFGIADLVDAFTRRECFELDLTGKDGGFVVIEQSEERN